MVLTQKLRERLSACSSSTATTETPVSKQNGHSALGYSFIGEHAQRTDLGVLGYACGVWCDIGVAFFECLVHRMCGGGTFQAGGK